jgi:hypothetical protein
VEERLEGSGFSLVTRIETPIRNHILSQCFCFVCRDACELLTKGRSVFSDCYLVCEPLVEEIQGEGFRVFSVSLFCGMAVNTMMRLWLEPGNRVDCEQWFG